VDGSSQDRRRLGVAVERIVLGGAGLRIEIAHDCPGLGTGFHEDEGGHRWTDGMARLSEEWLHLLAGDGTVEVQLVQTVLRYRADPPVGAAAALAPLRRPRPAPDRPIAPPRAARSAQMYNP